MKRWSHRASPPYLSRPSCTDDFYLSDPERRQALANAATSVIFKFAIQQLVDFPAARLA